MGASSARSRPQRKPTARASSSALSTFADLEVELRGEGEIRAIDEETAFTLTLHSATA